MESVFLKNHLFVFPFVYIPLALAGREQRHLTILVMIDASNYTGGLIP